MWDGRHYGIPGDTNTLGLYINVDLASAAGLNVETPPRNWQELTSWAEVLSNPERNIYGIAFSARQSEEGTFQWLPFLWQNGEDITTLDSPKAVEALALWVDWVNRGLASREVINYTQGDALGQFAASTTAMTINGSWQIPTLRRAENPINWKVVELPYSIQPASAMGGAWWRHVGVRKGRLAQLAAPCAAPDADHGRPSVSAVRRPRPRRCGAADGWPPPLRRRAGCRDARPASLPTPPRHARRAGG